MEPNTVIFIGRPGSGKGTQAALLAKKLNWKLVSAGNQFKWLRSQEGPLASRIQADYDQGKLTPDWVADYLFAHAILNIPTDEGMVLEGFGRSRPQAEKVYEILTWLGRKAAVVHLSVSEEETLKRQRERAETEFRPDSDSEEKLKVRLAEYCTNTEPALGFFQEKGLLIEVDGEPSIDAIHEEILSKLKFQ